jgi:hypothetical protein
MQKIARVLSAPATLLTLLLSTGSGAHAGIIKDPFAQSQAGGCNYSFIAPFSSCDVIGDPALYDIQSAKVELGAASGEVTLNFNYGGGITLAPFTDGIPLSVGDLFFYNPQDPAAAFIYGIPLYDHGGFKAGNVYHVGGATTLLTADDLIHNTGYYYRRTQQVWLGGTAGAGTPGSISVLQIGNGTTSALYAAKLSFDLPSGFAAAVISNKHTGISFASAYCGNDVLQGAVETAPEPAPLMLAGLGLTVIAVLSRQRRRHARM